MAVMVEQESSRGSGGWTGRELGMRGGCWCARTALGMATYSRGERDGLGCCRACPAETLATASEHGMA